MNTSIKDLAAHCARYRTPSKFHAVRQIANTTIPFVALSAAMYFSLHVGYWLTLLLAIPLAGCALRFFIIQHDCGHGSFFASKRANDITGRIVSILTITPYAYWRRLHALHHASSSNLDRRGFGDINTLTTDEYKALTPMRRLGYRIYRHPAFLLMIGGPIHFLLLQRLPLTLRRPAWEMWSSVMIHNLAMLAFYGTLLILLGWVNFAVMVVPVLVAAAAMGVWLFYVQHQFETTSWDKSDAWDRQSGALQGSSYYELPRVLRWFTGNIGLHHIHHLCSHIPNYRLQECLDAMPELKTINRLTIMDSLRTASLALWDPRQRKLVGFQGV
ncbi:fatty acid desaturase [Parvibaculum lavamentivorans DS-1]|uniref:Fatty acid desaturase n=1 Tax=Parvibaculum lavamentivorans (strain DS-1 / DSM 13023 / NCIMB 13966) TaxID=402881 RepID=A7HYA4_PARL1|nr:fatty acid desaturase [Parvibaculum lavamentivorans]ABS64887.1 fatty acid desaturase [Parvibaculum lavamentivorans DS-1]